MPPASGVRAMLVAGPLANVSIMYRNRNYIGDRIFPLLSPVSPKAKILKYLKGAFFRDEAGIRAPGTRSNRGTIITDYEDVRTKEYSMAKEVTEEDREEAKMAGAPPIQPDQEAVEYCADKVDLKKEKVVAKAVLENTWSGVAGGYDVQGKWAAGETNTFLKDVETAKEAMLGTTGQRPNCLMITSNVLPQLKEESTVMDKIKYTERGIVTPTLLASLLELDEVMVGDAVFSTAKEKKDGTDFTAQRIWEKNPGKGSAFLFYRPPGPGLKVPAAGYQARTPYGKGQVRKTTTWHEPAEHQDVYESAEQTDIVVCGPDLGFLFVDCILT